MRVPIVMVNAQGLVAWANDRAQRALLDVDVTDMPIECFVVDWARKRPSRREPTRSFIEFLFRDGRYVTVCAAVFQFPFEEALVSVIVFPEPAQATI